MADSKLLRDTNRWSSRWSRGQEPGSTMRSVDILAPFEAAVHQAGPLITAAKTVCRHRTDQRLNPLLAPGSIPGAAQPDHRLDVDHQPLLSDFISNGGAALEATTTAFGVAKRHYCAVRSDGPRPCRTRPT